MKRVKYLIPFFVGTLIYVIISVCFGQNSIKRQKYLEEQQKIIINQVAFLESINSELTLEVNALKNDYDVIAAYARKLDYVSDDEKLVKITGLNRSQPPLYDAGTVVRHEESTYVSEFVCKIISILFCILFLILLLLYDISKGNFKIRNKSQPVVKGIPIYDLQQI